MKLGTQIKFASGREATVVYNGLEGVGVKFGIHYPDPKDFEETSGGLFDDDVKEDWPWEPDALLRKPWNNCEEIGWDKDQCISEEYEITFIPTDGESNEQR